MSTDKQTQALKLALEALEGCEDVTADVVKAITAIREALAEQPAQQREPVAWMIWTHGPVLVFMSKDEANMEFDRLNHAYPDPTRMLVPLYTSPPANANAGKPWVGLTDEEMNAALDYWSEDERSAYGGAHAADGEYVSMIDTWRYIEAKLKEKNGF